MKISVFYILTYNTRVRVRKKREEMSKAKNKNETSVSKNCQLIFNTWDHNSCTCTCGKKVVFKVPLVY